MVLDPSQPTLEVGDRIRLRPLWKCAVKGNRWPVTAMEPVLWQSADTGVASVSREGVVLGRALGQAEILAIRLTKGRFWSHADTARITVQVQGADRF
jgi:hypothetical protein